MKKCHYDLTQREREAMDFACMGKTDEEIAMILQVTHTCIRGLMQRVKWKLDVANRAHAVAAYLMPTKYGRHRVLPGASAGSPMQTPHNATAQEA